MVTAAADQASHGDRLSFEDVLIDVVTGAEIAPDDIAALAKSIAADLARIRTRQIG